MRNLFYLFFKKWGKKLQTRYILSLKESVFVLFLNSRLFVYLEDPTVNKEVKGFSKYAVSKQSLNFRSFEPRFFLFKSFFPSTNLFWHLLCLCLNNCQVVGLSNVTLRTCCLKDCKVSFKATKQQLIIIIGLLPLKVNLNLNWTKLACTIFIYQNSLLVNKTAILMN